MIKSELEWFKAQGIRVKILDIPSTLLCCDCGEQDWVLEMVTNVLIEVISSVAQEERLKIHQRQKEGIAVAKEKGVVFGRPSVAKPENFEAIMELVDSGQMKSVEAMRELGVKKTTYYKLRQTYWQAADRA